MGDAVHALGGRGNGLVGRVASGEVALMVLTSTPGDFGTGGFVTVALLDPAPLHVEQFLAGVGRGVVLGETLAVHGACYLEPGVAVCPGCGLRFDEAR